MPAAVRITQEFDRIAALPRRELTLERAVELAAELTPLVTRPNSAARRKGLLPWQAVALVEAAENHGAWLALPVGTGKTLIAELLPVVMETEGSSVLMLPASLRDKTYAERAELATEGWLISNPPARIITREEMQTETGSLILQQVRPRLIVIDEADEFSNAGASAPARVDRYVLASDTEGRPVSVVPMTGTPSRNSILGYWHLLCWALGERAPVPLNREEAAMWAQALDEKPNARGKGVRRPNPGPLGPSLESAREWYARRLREAPGVVIVDEDSAMDVPLRVDLRYARECPTIDEHFERFAKYAQSPDGLDVTDALSAWRMDAQLGSGLYSYFDPQPPEAWRDARRAMARFVRWAIEHSRAKSRRPLDTEGQVFHAFPERAEIATWLAVRDTFDAEAATRWRWLSRSAVDSAIDWLRESDSPGIVMCGSVEFGEELARRAGLSYYGRQGRSASGQGLHAADPTRSLVASWHAAKRGFNLQAWQRLLIAQPPTSAKYLEQIFGRLHRRGQQGSVAATLLVTSGGTIDAFRAALAEAHFARSTVSLAQKILRAEIVEPPRPKPTATNRFRWASRDEPAATIVLAT